MLTHAVATFNRNHCCIVTLIFYITMVTQGSVHEKSVSSHVISKILKRIETLMNKNDTEAAVASSDVSTLEEDVTSDTLGNCLLRKPQVDRNKGFNYTSIRILTFQSSQRTRYSTGTRTYSSFSFGHLDKMVDGIPLMKRIPFLQQLFLTIAA